MQIYINGKPCDAFPEDTILQVALRNDIYIPHLCFNEKTDRRQNAAHVLWKWKGFRD